MAAPDRAQEHRYEVELHDGSTRIQRYIGKTDAECRAILDDLCKKADPARYVAGDDEADYHPFARYKKLAPPKGGWRS